MTKEELKTHIETRYSECSKRSQGLSYGSFYDGYMDCYTEFEKENEELKEKYVKECEDVMYVVTNYTKQLTKAKEIIKKLIALNRKGWIYSDVREEAEQFLKDSEVKK